MPFHRARPIQRQAKDIPFPPLDVTLLNEAIDQATDALKIAPDQTQERELLARLVVQAAIDNENLDAAGLCRQAIVAFENRRKHRQPEERQVDLHHTKGQISMSLQPYLKGITFRPSEVSRLGEALERATEALNIASNQTAKRELVARLIVQAASDNENLDAAGLCRKVIAALRKSRRESATRLTGRARPARRRA